MESSVTNTCGIKKPAVKRICLNVLAHCSLTYCLQPAQWGLSDLSYTFQETGSLLQSEPQLYTRLIYRDGMKKVTDLYYTLSPDTVSDLYPAD